MTTSTPPPHDPRDLIAVLQRMARSWTALILVGLLFVAETLNYGILPAVLKTIEANMAAAKSTTEDAKAQAAKIREQGLADAASEDARVKAGQALQADRFRKAEARRADNMARVLQEKAINSPELQKAETEIKRQTAVIDDEKAKHEARRARAQAELTAAQAQIEDWKAKLRLATIRSEIISRRFEQLSQCASETIASDPGALIELGQQGATWDRQRPANTPESFYRKRCLSQIR